MTLADAITAYVWGDNEWAQAGTGAKSHAILKPEHVPALDGASDIVLNSGHTLFVRAGAIGSVGGNTYGGACIGHNAYDEILPSPVKADLPEGVLALSMDMAILADRTVRCWSGNGYGQCGVGTWTHGAEKLSPPGLYPSAQSPQGLPPVALIGAGQYHRFAVDEQGRVWAWGFNDRGELGLGVTGAKLVPTLVPFTRKPVKADGGNKHSGLLCPDGTVWLFGSNASGQLGQPANVGYLLRPTEAPVLDPLADISLGGNFTLLLDKEGHVWMAGTFLSEELPIYGWRHIPFPEPVEKISAGTNHALALGKSGMVYGWGHNRYGQLGDGTQTYTANNDKPAPVALGITASAIFAGVINSAALA